MKNCAVSSEETLVTNPTATPFGKGLSYFQEMAYSIFGTFHQKGCCVIFVASFYCVTWCIFLFAGYLAEQN